MDRPTFRDPLGDVNKVQDSPEIPIARPEPDIVAFQVAQATTPPVDETRVTQTFTATAGGRIELPAGATAEQIIKVGSDLYLVQANGDLIKIVNGAVFSTTLVVGGIEIPAEALTVALAGAEEGVPTAGPEIGGQQTQSSGNTFEDPTGVLGPGLELIDLLEPEALQFFVPVIERREEPFNLEETETAPVIGTPDPTLVEDDDLSNGIDEDGSGGSAVMDMGGLGVDFGGNPGTIAFLPALDGATMAISGGSQLTSSGETVVLALINPKTLVGYVDSNSAGAVGSFDSGIDREIFRITIDDTVPGGKYKIIISDSIDHLPNTPGEEFASLQFPFVATNSGGSAEGSFQVIWHDDIPVEFTPDSASLKNSAGSMVTAALDIDSNVDDNVGADDVGTITFANISNGDDSGLTFGSPILLFLVDNDNDPTNDDTNPPTLQGRTGDASGPLVFEIVLNHDATNATNDTYKVTIHREIFGQDEEQSPFDLVYDLALTDADGDFVIVDNALNVTVFPSYGEEFSSTDPIVIDLSDPGIGFTSLASSVPFDIDVDGTPENVAWTAGTDGILAVDIDGSGLIEDGSEIFTPDFAAGGFASALEALASLDSDGDSLITAADEAFEDILVWVDGNHDGISQAGELTNLTDNGIVSIDLGAQAADYEISGQQIIAVGHYTLDTDETRDYVAVELDQFPIAAAAGDNILNGGPGENTLTGGPGADIFVLTHMDAADIIIDFDAEEGDRIDLTALFDLSDAANVDAAELAGFVSYDSNDGSLRVDPTGADAANSGIKVATLENTPTNVTIVVDDASGNTSSETIA